MHVSFAYLKPLFYHHWTNWKLRRLPKNLKTKTWKKPVPYKPTNRHVLVFLVCCKTCACHWISPMSMDMGSLNPWQIDHPWKMVDFMPIKLVISMSIIISFFWVYHFTLIVSVCDLWVYLWLWKGQLHAMSRLICVFLIFLYKVLLSVTFKTRLVIKME